VVEIRARLRKDDRSGANSLTAQDVKLLKPRKARQVRPEQEPALPESVIKPLVLRLDSSRHSTAELESLKTVLLSHPGGVPVEFEITTLKGQCLRLAAGDDYRIEQSKDLIQALLSWMK
jgi:hypothetical protein